MCKRFLCAIGFRQDFKNIYYTLQTFKKAMKCQADIELLAGEKMKDAECLFANKV